MSKRRRGQRRKQNKQGLYISGAIVIIIAVSAVIYLAVSRGEGPGEEITDQGNRHVEQEPTRYIWNLRPPTSGPHAGNIANWGVHEETVPEWLQVHNLEDGGVILHYNCPEGCEETVAELRDIVSEVGTEQLIMHPYTNMEERIAVTAWTRLLTMEEVDRDAIVDFVESYRGIDHH